MGVVPSSAALNAGFAFACATPATYSPSSSRASCVRATGAGSGPAGAGSVSRGFTASMEERLSVSPWLRSAPVAMARTFQRPLRFGWGCWRFGCQCFWVLGEACDVVVGAADRLETHMKRSAFRRSTPYSLNTCWHACVRGVLWVSVKSRR
jgi:hypothetical protein